VRRLGSLKEKWLQSGLGHIPWDALTALLAGGSGGRENVYREKREEKPILTQARSSKDCQEWDITSLLTVAIFL